MSYEKKTVPNENKAVSNDSKRKSSDDMQMECLDGELKDAFADLLSLHPPEEGAKVNGVNGDVGNSGTSTVNISSYVGRDY